MLVTEHADAGRIQHKPPAVPGRQAEPAGGEHPQEMGAGEDQHRTVNLADLPDDPAGPLSGIRRRLAPWAAVPKQLPAGTLGKDLFRRQALVSAVIPFGKVVLLHASGAKACKRAGVERPLRRA